MSYQVVHIVEDIENGIFDSVLLSKFSEDDFDIATTKSKIIELL